MSQYNSLKVKLSNSQINKLMSPIKIEAEVILRLSSNIVSNSDYELQIFLKLLKIVHQLILSYQKPYYLI